MADLVSVGDPTRVGVSAHPKYIDSYLNRLRKAGLVPEAIRANGTFGKHVKVVLLRAHGSSTDKAQALRKWIGKDPSRQLLTVRGGPGEAVRLLQSIGVLVPGSVAEEDPDGAAPPQRADYTHDGAFFVTLLDRYGTDCTPKVAQRICSNQRVSFKQAAYCSTGRQWALMRGKPIPVWANEDAPAALVDNDDDLGEPLPTQPFLNDILPESYPSTSQWIDAVLVADLWVTVNHVRALAREHGVEKFARDLYAQRVKVARVAAGLPATMERTGSTALARPACWRPGHGVDPEQWPQPNMRPVPSIRELRDEIELWEEEFDALREKHAAELAAVSVDGASVAAKEAQALAEKRVRSIGRSLAEALETLQTAEERFAQERDSLLADIESLRATLATREDACRSWKSRAEAAEASPAPDEATVTALRQSVRDLELQVKLANSATEKQTAAAATHRRDATELRRTLKRVEATRDKYEARVIAAEERADEKEVQRATLEGKLRAVQSKNDKLSKTPALDPYAVAKKALHLSALFDTTDWDKLEAALRGMLE